MKSPNTPFTILLMFICYISYAQTKVSGTVANNKEKPIAGALIYLDSVNSNVKTNKLGYYEVNVPENVQMVHVYSSKYGLLSTEYDGESSVDFVYLEGKLSAKERISEKSVVSIEYDAQEEQYVANKVEDVDSEERIDAVRFLSIYDLIRDRVSGVRVTSDNKIIIRGVNSFISSQDPLFVVDGNIVSSIDFILPVDVEKISVLKGSEASMYGTRGANGVLVIKTKK